MNIGKLNERITVLAMDHIEYNYSWKQVNKIWASSECLRSNNIFSKVGISAKSIKFLIRKNSTLTLHNAIRWNQKHCFITDIIEKDKMYYEISAALIEPKICTVERANSPQLNSLNRPIYVEPTIVTFPACLTEKYIKQTEEQPMSTIESCYVLVTPKAINLLDGELVTINNIAYEVVVSHTLDEFKNEYEIRERRNP